MPINQIGFFTISGLFLVSTLYTEKLYKKYTNPTLRLWELTFFVITGLFLGLGFVYPRGIDLYTILVKVGLLFISGICFYYSPWVLERGRLRNEGNDFKEENCGLRFVAIFIANGLAMISIAYPF